MHRGEGIGTIAGPAPPLPPGIDRRLLMERRIQRLERLLTRRNAWLALSALAVISVVFAVALRDVRVDYDFEKFFPNDDPELDRYLAFRERFGFDNDFLLIGIEGAEGVFRNDLLIKADSLAARLERLPLVMKVVTPTRLNEPIVTPLGVFERPYLRVGADSLLALDSARIWSDPRVREAFFSKDGKAMLLAMNAQPGLSKEKCDLLLADVRDALVQVGLPDARLAGRIIGQDHYIVTMVREMVLFLSCSIALLAVFLWFGFRSIHGVIVPIAVVGLAILWQVGFMTVLGKPIGILTMLLPTILFVVGMSDVVHILECYLDEIRAGVPRIRAIAVTYHEVGLPTFLTAVTSGIGFATLGTASIPPLQEFGFYTAIGVLVAFGLAFTLLPALLVLTDPRKLLPRSDRGSPLDGRLQNLFRWTLRHRRGILVGFAAVSVLGIVGASRIQVNNHLLEDLPDNDPMKQGFLWFERSFGGVRPFEMEFEAVGAESVWEVKALREIEKVQDHADSVYGVDAINSPVTVMRSLNKAFNGGDASFYTLPADSAENARMARRAKLVGKQLLGAVVTDDGQRARLSGRMVDEGGRVHKGRNEVMDRFIASNVDTGIVRVHQTGMAYLIDRNNATLSTQLVRGMGLAILLTALIMLWFFRDWRMVLVALIPNLVPLLFIAGVMGFTGIELKVSTAIIFSIAFGIAEDDTIHMLAALRQNLREGLSPAFALRRTYSRTGKAVTVTNIMLVSGFIALMLSDFSSIRYMGILITSTLAFAFVAELLLLPALVTALMRPERKG
ncbi:MAG: RND family transporter [Flavobacteriales bacterium]|nr:RND family transporter [Flavobacteriales bacterium]